MCIYIYIYIPAIWILSRGRYPCSMASASVQCLSTISTHVPASEFLSWRNADPCWPVCVNCRTGNYQSPFTLLTFAIIIQREVDSCSGALDPNIIPYLTPPLSPIALQLKEMNGKGLLGDVPSMSEGYKPG